MALSDYLTSDEWDGAAYVCFIEGKPNLGDAMRYFIAEMLKKGYTFSGLDDEGNKKEQIVSDNADKLVTLFLKGGDIQTLSRVLRNGRAFCRKHCPEIIKTIPDDAEFEKEIQKAEEDSKS